MEEEQRILEIKHTWWNEAMAQKDVDKKWMVNINTNLWCRLLGNQPDFKEVAADKLKIPLQIINLADSIHENLLLPEKIEFAPNFLQADILYFDIEKDYNKFYRLFLNQLLIGIDFGLYQLQVKPHKEVIQIIADMIFKDDFKDIEAMNDICKIRYSVLTDFSKTLKRAPTYQLTNMYDQIELTDIILSIISFIKLQFDDKNDDPGPGHLTTIYLRAISLIDTDAYKNWVAKILISSLNLKTKLS